VAGLDRERLPGAVKSCFRSEDHYPHHCCLPDRRRRWRGLMPMPGVPRRFRCVRLAIHRNR
jgi:hypothetical protein